MRDFYKDLLIGILFIIGLTGFISGEFIISSTLFAAAAVASNVNPKRVKSGLCLWD
jgi:CheY-specific phosphatase CheX